MLLVFRPAMFEFRYILQSGWTPGNIETLYAQSKVSPPGIYLPSTGPILSRDTDVWCGKCDALHVLPKGTTQVERIASWSMHTMTCSSHNELDIEQ